ncbi:MAG TPA: hypothetical protein PK691_03655 [Thermomicrobiales bacterium]|nr:hypothetical protein [Thermomicrobiales bacterium]
MPLLLTTRDLLLAGGVILVPLAIAVAVTLWTLQPAVLRAERSRRAEKGRKARAAKAATQATEAASKDDLSAP